MSRADAERRLVRCQGFDVGIEDHGLPCMHGTFVTDGSGQGLGCVIDMDFVERLLAVFGVDRVSRVNGLPCWILADWGKIYVIEPLMPKEGKILDVEEWAVEATKRAKAIKGAHTPRPGVTGGAR